MKNPCLGCSTPTKCRYGCDGLVYWKPAIQHIDTDNKKMLLDFLLFIKDERWTGDVLLDEQLVIDFLEKIKK